MLALLLTILFQRGISVLRLPSLQSIARPTKKPRVNLDQGQDTAGIVAEDGARSGVGAACMALVA